ncbi:hypothetical protein [Erythrobacter sp.]|uniref:hypothetical protein n=1 Tax=Erythrobacter sp. TaxID=1042 RepID=UPI003C724012
MDVSFASIQIAILALPGILWAGLDSSTSHSAKTTGLRFWLKVFVFGLFSYAVLALFYRWLGFDFDAFQFDTENQSNFADKADEVIWAVPLSLVLACLWIAAKTHGIIPRFLRWVRISDASGCDDIWEYSLSKQSPVGNWVHVRDFQNKAIYEGWVKAYSDGTDVRELLLGHVSVYGFDGEKAYDQHALYLSRPTDNMNLEFCVEVNNERQSEN